MRLFLPKRRNCATLKDLKRNALRGLKFWNLAVFSKVSRIGILGIQRGLHEERSTQGSNGHCPAGSHSTAEKARARPLRVPHGAVTAAGASVFVFER